MEYRDVLLNVRTYRCLRFIAKQHLPVTKEKIIKQSQHIARKCTDY